MRALFLVCAFALAACNLTFSSGDEMPDHIAITPDAVTMERTGHTTLIATYVYDPAAFAATDVVWSSSMPRVATIHATGAELLVTAVAPGTTTISATGSGLTASVEIVVATPHAVSLVVDPPQPTTPIGVITSLVAIATMSDGTSQNVTSDATWLSSAPSIATVDDGSIHGLALGDSTISAQFEGQFSSTRATITKAVITSISVTPNQPTVVTATPVSFTAMGTFSNNTISNITATVTWSSSVPAVATISNVTGTKGIAQTLSAGTTTIAATSGAVTGSSLLTVTN